MNAKIDNRKLRSRNGPFSEKIVVFFKTCTRLLFYYILELNIVLQLIIKLKTYTMSCKSKLHLLEQVLKKNSNNYKWYPPSQNTTFIYLYVINNLYPTIQVCFHLWPFLPYLLVWLCKCSLFTCIFVILETMDLTFWAHFPGLPVGVKWPMRLHRWDSNPDLAVVFCHADIATYCKGRFQGKKILKTVWKVPILAKKNLEEYQRLCKKSNCL